MSTNLHDKLLSECYIYVWNSRVQFRRCIFHIPNEVRRYKKETAKEHMIRVQQSRAIGMLPGVLDFIIFYRGRLFITDAKIPPDRLSEAQEKFIEVITSNGGIFLGTFATLDEFKLMMDRIENFSKSSL